MTTNRKEPITQADRDWNNMMDASVQKDRLDYILDKATDLSAKELGFLGNVQTRLDKNYALTEPQAKWLEDIYNRID